MHISVAFDTDKSYSIAKGTGTTVGLRARGPLTQLEHINQKNKMAYNGGQVTKWCQIY